MKFERKASHEGREKAQRAGTAEAAFDEGLREARLTRLMSDKEFARAFALAYVGVDR